MGPLERLGGTDMKPVWIVDDDRSIRWVLEKALARENIPCRAFGLAQEVLAELEHDSPQVLVSDIRMPGQSGIRASARGETQASGAARNHHDGVLGSGQRCLSLPRRRVRIFAKAIRRRQGGGADSTRGR